MSDATQKSAIVTGGAAGLGAAFVAQLLNSDFHVTMLDIAEPQEPHPNLRFITCDLANRDALDLALGDLALHGPYNLLVLNAGISATGKFEAIAPSAYDKLIAINAEAPMVMASHLVPHMSPKGAILFVSSLSHFTGYPGAAIYGGSKDAIAVFAKSIRKTCAKQNISVTVAFPGPLRTDHAARHAPKGTNAEKRMLPEDAARLILADTFRGQKNAIPGFGNKLFALLGKIFPKPITFAMRKLIYDKLDGPVI